MTQRTILQLKYRKVHSIGSKPKATGVGRWKSLIQQRRGIPAILLFHTQCMTL
jgi:hypothetical protein